MASGRAGVGNGDEARRLGRASLGMSLAGIFIGCIVIGILVAVNITHPQHYG